MKYVAADRSCAKTSQQMASLVFAGQPGKQHQSDVCSCLRDWRLSASWGTIESPSKPIGPSQHYRIEGFKILLCDHMDKNHIM